jgi:opacity protein-like surface antigen
MNNWFGLAVELSGQYGSQTLSIAGPSGRTTQVKADVDFHSLGFGPRFTYRQNERLSPFAHVLFGVARGNWKRPAIVAGEETSFAAAVGGGFDTKLVEHVSFRIIQAEYVRTHFGANVQKHFRIATGLVFSF